MEAFEFGRLVETRGVNELSTAHSPYKLKTKPKTTIELMGNVDTCVACGEYVPEGRQVCINCEKKYEDY